MPDFTLHQTDDNATPAQKEIFQRAQEAMGMVPNLIRILAGSPAAANAYLDLSARLAETDLTPAEQQAVLLSASFENGCHYCMAAHTGGAKQAGMDEDALEALRTGAELDDPRLAAIRSLTREIVESRGYPSDEAVEAFRDAGFQESQILGVMVGVALKTLSNYVNHMADTPLDEALQPFAWTPEDAVAV